MRRLALSLMVAAMPLGGYALMVTSVEVAFATELEPPTMFTLYALASACVTAATFLLMLPSLLVSFIWPRSTRLLRVRQVLVFPAWFMLAFNTGVSAELLWVGPMAWLSTLAHGSAALFAAVCWLRGCLKFWRSPH